MELPKRVTFSVTENQYEKIKALPREYNLSELLRDALDKILNRVEKERAK
ncbi:MAG: hypothetical protein O8C58_01080 [Candidatus Methanoperedens sp.]|nr:hypothetical protein [Candidatus Methanoperedens sp.]